MIIGNHIRNSFFIVYQVIKKMNILEYSRINNFNLLKEKNITMDKLTQTTTYISITIKSVSKRFQHIIGQGFSNHKMNMHHRITNHTFAFAVSNLLPTVHTI